MRRFLVWIPLLIAAAISSAAPSPHASASGPNCFTVVVGRRASATGAVVLAHNEDDYPPQVVNLLKVPRITHDPGETIPLQDGGAVPQVPETAAYVWLEMAGQSFADCFLNEYGVTIVSNQCTSRMWEDRAALTGLGWELRQILAGRAHTAREAVAIAGRLVERYGYRDSGRTYTIADPNEAWMLAVTGGKHWVAARIPDDSVAVLANIYTIGVIDLGDPSRFLADPDLIPYAIRHGWYDPDRDGPFNFSRAYSGSNPMAGLHSVPRWWFGVAFLSGAEPDILDLPFAFRPAHPVTLTDLFALLRSHFEGTQFEAPRSYDQGNPHHNATKRICSDSTEYGIVAELRPTLPPAIGNLLWFAPRRPCTEPFVPIYSGVSSLPAAYTEHPWQQTLENHLRDDPSNYSPDPGHAWWAFVSRARTTDADYGRLIPAIRSARDRFQGEVLAARERFERRVLTGKVSDEAALERAVTRFTGSWLERLWEQARSPLPAPVPDGSGRLERTVHSQEQGSVAATSGSATCGGR